MRSASLERMERAAAGEDEKLLDEQPQASNASNQHDVRGKRLLFILAALCIALVSFAAGMLFGITIQGSLTVPSDEGDAQAVPQVAIDREIRTFQLGPSFATVPPKNQSEPAWDSLLPNGLGYVNNTQIAPDFSVISVFHQLHCLYTLRRAYFAEQAGDKELQDFDFGHDRNEHAGHCFEYLRQSLMCSADSSVEPAHVEKKGGQEFLGWDVPRMCRNYDQLKNWAEERRAFDAHGFLANDLRGSGHE